MGEDALVVQGQRALKFFQRKAMREKQERIGHRQRPPRRLNVIDDENAGMVIQRLKLSDGARKLRIRPVVQIIYLGRTSKACPRALLRLALRP